MAARVIHVGPDDCHRLMVLRSAGFAVDGCLSLTQFRASLLSGSRADAILLSDGEGFAPKDAAILARSCSSAPVVLFGGTNRTYEGAMFDLVVHSLTPPEVWLHEVDALIAKNRVLSGRLAAIPRKSARMRSMQEPPRNADFPPGDRLGQDSLSPDSLSQDSALK